jgi:hypothetical protein
LWLGGVPQNSLRSDNCGKSDHERVCPAAHTHPQPQAPQAQTDGEGNPNRPSAAMACVEFSPHLPVPRSKKVGAPPGAVPASVLKTNSRSQFDSPPRKHEKNQVTYFLYNRKILNTCHQLFLLTKIARTNLISKICILGIFIVNYLIFLNLY